MFLLISLLLLISNVESRTDKFTFNLKITCRHTQRPTFWYQLELLENDTLSPRDAVQRILSETIPTGTKQIKVFGYQDGDEYLSDGYRLSAVFKHDCTYNGNQVEVNYTFKKLCKIEHDCQIDFVADLTDQYGYIETNARIQSF
ncbi:unnamed protein product [Caenorhabditis angaria]|uniref:Uncharacterized protein n=1 Tax=Caenorhabditis angaria TaxID=860376 RepID=A0A9P1MZR7_9PELO|nr:unnamed protein product [Caenorhabditis angaria]